MEAVEGDSGEHFADDAQQRDAAVVTVAAVALVLVEGDDVGISHVLGDASLFPA